MEEPWAGDQVAPTGLRRKRKHIKAGSGGAGWTPGGWLAGEAQPMPTASTAGQLSGSRWGSWRLPLQGQAPASGSRSVHLLQTPSSGLVPRATVTCLPQAGPGKGTFSLGFPGTAPRARPASNPSNSQPSLWASSLPGSLATPVNAMPSWAAVESQSCGHRPRWPVWLGSATTVLPRTRCGHWCGHGAQAVLHPQGAEHSCPGAHSHTQ